MNSNSSRNETPNPTDWLYASFVDAAKKLDAWTIENPYQAAAIGAAAGLATSIVFIKILVLNGAVAVASNLYGTAKGAAIGYAYPTVRPYIIDGFSQAAGYATKAREEAGQMYDDAVVFAEDVRQEMRNTLDQLNKAIKQILGKSPYLSRSWLQKSDARIFVIVTLIRPRKFGMLLVGTVTISRYDVGVNGKQPTKRHGDASC